MSKDKAKSLKALRNTLGLSQEKLADSIGVGRDTVRRWEKGTSTPQRRFCGKISDIFDNNLTLAQSGEVPEGKTTSLTEKDVSTKRFQKWEEEKSITAAESRAAIARSFTVGSYYYIHEGNLVPISDTLQQSVLRYERKSGIHHVFRAVKGNWLITYTDAQLVGKNVKEVDANGNCKA